MSLFQAIFRILLLRGLLLSAMLCLPLLSGHVLAEDWESRLRSAVSLVKQNRAFLPYPVDTALLTLEPRGLKRRFRCPAPSVVHGGEVEVLTSPVEWAPSVRIHDHDYGVPQAAAGYYVWAPQARWQAGYKTVTSNNRILFNPNRDTRRNDRFEFDILRDLVLSYHELLHGQLMLDAMDDPQWLHEFCNCQFPLEGSDPHHERIYPLLRQLVQNLVGGREDWVDLNIQPAGQELDFDHVMAVDTGLTSSGVHVGVLVFEFSNVDAASLGLEIKRSEVRVQGRRLDADEPAFVVLGVQPRF